MFLTEQDYMAVVDQRALDVITQANSQNRESAEASAVEEIAGYLRPKYDCGAIFSATGEERNKKIVQVACDISLYHLVSSVPAKMGYELRKERYDAAIKWLEGVASGKITPDLPLATSEDGTTATPLRWGSATRLDNIW
ncbi:MAG: DUF1320 family protein [Bacteroidales bacterium]|nr:DUF1320 family protein [Bacteroidales bacterium]